MLLAVVLLLSALSMHVMAAINEAGEVTSTEFTLSGYGYGLPAASCKAIAAKSGAATEVYVYYDGVCDEMNGTLTADRYLQAGKQYYFLIRYDAHMDTAGFADSFNPNEVPLLLNGEPCELINTVSMSTTVDGKRDEFWEAYYKLPVLEAVPVAIPFSKIVEVGGEVAPEGGSFELDVTNAESDSNCPIANYTLGNLNFSVEGQEPAEKYFTITHNDYGAILNLLDEGILVREKESAFTEWTNDDAVWCVMQHHDYVVNSLDAEAPTMTVTLDYFKGKVEEGEFVPDSNTPATQMSFTNIYTENYISVKIPFVKEVKQGGDVLPGEATFKLEIFDIGNGNAENYEDVSYTAEVKTNGVGKFNGEIVLTGPAAQIDAMLCEGFLVREVKDDDENWNYSDAVWAIIPEWNEQQEKVFVVYSTTKVPDVEGDYYTATETSVEKMSFENTYTKNNVPEAPSTGDYSMMCLFALVLVSAVGVAGTVVFSRKRTNMR